jgi:hypothetical protein
MLAVLLIGWAFILVYNNLHLRAPVVFMMLAYLAIVAAIYNLFRVGATAVEENDEDDGAAAWGLPLGARGELEREKRTLLKAIKEAEFDHQMGKLSKKDVDDMVRTYRARAIEVIKLLEDPGTKKGGTVREQIEREVRARIEVEGARKKGGKKQKAAEAAQAAARAAAARGASAEGVQASARAAAARVEEAEDEAAQAEAKADAKVDAKPEPGDAKAHAANGAAKAEDAGAAKADVAKADAEDVGAANAGAANADAAKADAAKADAAKTDAAKTDAAKTDAAKTDADAANADAANAEASAGKSDSQKEATP